MSFLFWALFWGGMNQPWVSVYPEVVKKWNPASTPPLLGDAGRHLPLLRRFQRLQPPLRRSRRSRRGGGGAGTLGAAAEALASPRGGGEGGGVGGRSGGGAFGGVKKAPEWCCTGFIAQLATKSGESCPTALRSLHITRSSSPFVCSRF